MKRRLKAVSAEIKKRQKELGFLTKSVRKEERDVNKLEQMSVKALFAKFRGNSKERIDFERQEYLMTVLKYNECLDILEALQFETAILEEKVAEIPALVKSYEELFRQKVSVIKQLDKAIEFQLNGLDRNESTQRRKLVDVEEAIEACKSASHSINLLLKYLEKAKDWSDTSMHGSGRYSSYAKKSYVNKARTAASRARVALDKFEKEAKDVFAQLPTADKFDIRSYDKFLETFYSNLIKDWAVQQSRSRISHQITGTSDKLTRMHSLLQSEQKEVQKQIRGIVRQRQKIVAAW